MSENMNVNKQQLLNAILSASGSKINKNAIDRAKSGDVSALAAGLDGRSRKELTAALNDREKAKEILASKEAKEIIKKFLGGNGNG